MLIAKVQGEQVIDVSDYRDMFPQTSFSTQGPSEQFLIENSCMIVTVWKPYNSRTEKLISVTPYIQNNTVYTVDVESLSQEEIDANTQVQWNKVRKERDFLLQSSDWTQLADVPLDETDKQKWIVYRQKLRDVTSQPDPYNIIWPEF